MNQNLIQSPIITNSTSNGIISIDTLGIKGGNSIPLDYNMHGSLPNTITFNSAPKGDIKLNPNFIVGTIKEEEENTEPIKPKSTRRTVKKPVRKQVDKITTTKKRTSR